MAVDDGGIVFKGGTAFRDEQTERIFEGRLDEDPAFQSTVIAVAGPVAEAEAEAVVLARAVARPEAAAVTMVPLPEPVDNTWRYNQSSYSEDNVLTLDDGTMYAVWIRSGDLHAMVGKLPAGSPVWETFDLRTIAGDPFGNQSPDGHNTFVLGIGPDGRVHVSGNVHGVALRYAVTTNPGNITAWSTPGMVGVDEASTSYPRFVNTIDGTLFFLYRSGTSGQGKYVLNRWTGSTWVRVAIVADGNPSLENAYENRVVANLEGGLDFSFMWRETSGAETNRHGFYVRWTGSEWLRSDGTTQAMPVTHANCEIILPLEQSTGLVNQTGMDIDLAGNPHIVWMFYDVGGKTQYYHQWHDGATWHIEQVTSFVDRVETIAVVGTLQLIVARPAIVCAPTGRIFIIGRARSTEGNRPLLIDVTSPGNPSTVLFDMALSEWEPAFDTRSLRRDGILRMLVTDVESPATAGTGYDRQWAGILGIDLGSAPLADGAAPRYGRAEAGRAMEIAVRGSLATNTDLDTLQNIDQVGAWLMGTGVPLVNQPTYGVTRPATLIVQKPHRSVTVQTIVDAEAQIFLRTIVNGTPTAWTVATGGSIIALANGTALSTLWHGDYFLTNTSAFPGEPSDFAALSPAQHGILEVRLISSSGGTSGIKFYRLTSFDRTKVWEATMSSGTLSAWVQTRGGQGTAAPAAAPAFVGQIFVDTTNSKAYIAKGTASAADWMILN